MRTVTLIAALALASAPTLAASPSYLGVWTSSPRACEVNPLRTDDAAFRITSKATAGYEWGCQIKSTSRAGEGGWRGALACAQERTESRRTVRWQVVGDKLVETAGGKTTVSVRCAPSDFRIPN